MPGFRRPADLRMEGHWQPAEVRRCTAPPPNEPRFRQCGGSKAATIAVQSFLTTHEGSDGNRSDRCWQSRRAPRGHGGAFVTATSDYTSLRRGGDRRCARRPVGYARRVVQRRRWKGPYSEGRATAVAAATRPFSQFASACNRYFSPVH
jgi:hypothetical protein